MERKAIITAIIASLEEKGIITGSHKTQGGKAVQFITADGEYFNLKMAKIIKGKSFIAPPLALKPLAPVRTRYSRQ